MLPWKCSALLSLVSGIELRFILFYISGFRELWLTLHATRMKTDPGHVL